MKKIKLLFIGLSVLFFANTAFAQEKGVKLDKDKAKIEKVINDLELNDKQAVELKAIYSEYKPKIDNAKSDEAKMKYRAEMKNKIGAMLDKGQLEKWKAMQASTERSATKSSTVKSDSGY